jgi:hypothetical protein
MQVNDKVYFYRYDVKQIGVIEHLTRDSAYISFKKQFHKSGAVKTTILKIKKPYVKVIPN